MKRCLLSISLLALLSAGCATGPYAVGYHYYPQPVTVNVIRRGGNQAPPLTVLVSILGVRNPDAERHIPYSVAVRMRFEDLGPSRVSFDPRSLDLVTGMLRAFSPPITNPPQAIELSPGQRQEVTAYFPFPPGTKASQMDMRNLRLRWEVKIDDYPVQQTALFERVDSAPDVDTDLYY